MLENLTILESYDKELAALKVMALKYAGSGINTAPSGRVDFGHRPQFGSRNYALRLFPGIRSELLEIVTKEAELNIPPAYGDFLKRVNGLYCFGLSLCGIPDSYPMMNRSDVECHDLVSCAKSWRLEYRVSERFFHFGARHYTMRSNVGYFMKPDGEVSSYMKGGKLIGRWSTMKEFLEVEVAAAENYDIEHPPMYLAVSADKRKSK